MARSANGGAPLSPTHHRRMALPGPLSVPPPILRHRRDRTTGGGAPGIESMSSAFIPKRLNRLQARIRFAFSPVCTSACPCIGLAQYGRRIAMPTRTASSRAHAASASPSARERRDRPSYRRHRCRLFRTCLGSRPFGKSCDCVASVGALSAFQGNGSARWKQPGLISHQGWVRIRVGRSSD
jgi:hypothetical protein